MGERMRQTDYADRVGVSKQRISQLAKDGRVVLDERGLVDVEASDRNLATQIDQRKANRDRQVELAGRVGTFDGAQVAAPASARANVDQVGAPTGALAFAGPILASSAEPTSNGAETAATAAIGAPTAPSGRGEAPEAPENNAAGGYWGHKAKREEAEAALAQLKLQERIGVLVLADEVSRSRRATAFKVANALTQLPAKLAPVVAPQDPQRAETLLAEEIDRVLNELSDDLDQSAAADDAERALARAA